MISYNDAIKIIRDTASSIKLGAETIPIENSVGRICAQDLMVNINIQPFDNSAMDGFAVCFDDLEKINNSNNITLRKLGIIGAGEDISDKIIQQGTCWHIMTGAQIPPNTASIIPVEDVTINDQNIIFKSPIKNNQNIRRAGQDFKKGTIIALKGEKISPAHILPLATIGISEISVIKKPRVLFLSTGTEIIDDLNSPLKDGQIYNSNMPFTVAFLNACGVDILIEETIKDNLDEFQEILKTAKKQKYDIIISSGAVSAGVYDFVKDGLLAFGANILYHKIKLKPGKPNLFAKLPNGTLYFGLPGNPAATAVGLRFFVIEALRAIQGQKQESPIFVRVMNKFSKKSGLHMVLKGRFESWEDGSLSVDILDGQESFMVNPFLIMDNWLHVPEDVEVIKAGDVIEVYPFMP